MVGQRLRRPVLTRGDQIPDETFDVLISAVMQQAISQEGSTDGFHIRLLQGALEAAMRQDVNPPSPSKNTSNLCY